MVDLTEMDCVKSPPLVPFFYFGGVFWLPPKVGILTSKPFALVLNVGSHGFGLPFVDPILKLIGHGCLAKLSQAVVFLFLLKSCVVAKFICHNFCSFISFIYGQEETI